MLQPTLICYYLYNVCTCSGIPSWLSFISIIFQTHGASWLPNCTKILHMVWVRMRTVAIALNYSVKNIWNHVWQIMMNMKIAIQLTSVGLAHTIILIILDMIMKVISWTTHPTTPNGMENRQTERQTDRKTKTSQSRSDLPQLCMFYFCMASDVPD